jgi:hypothetical protein
VGEIFNSSAKPPQKLGNGFVNFSNPDSPPILESIEIPSNHDANDIKGNAYGTHTVDPGPDDAVATPKLDEKCPSPPHIVDNNPCETEDCSSHGSPEKGNTEIPCPSTIATDSGYASMGGIPDPNEDDDQDDNRTVCTDNQELDVPENVKEKLATAFSCEVIRGLQTTVSKEWTSKTDLRNSLVEILREYSIRCRRGAGAGQQRDATTFVRHYRR